jgi:16S rRNA (cytosine1402-N4)-methyltransferase
METKSKKYHEPVLLKELLDYLDPGEGEVIVDSTFGFGGHSAELLKKIGSTGRLIAIEQDKAVFGLVIKRFNDERIIFVNENFSKIDSILKERKIAKVDKILFDLGISSYHFDELNKGFSFSDEELDMRLDRSTGITAEEIVNTMPEEELANLLYQNADEFLSRRIARVIVDARKKKKIESAKELAEIINQSVRRRGKINPATKTFQALRIAVNREFEVLEEGLSKAVNLLKKNGRIAVISFHSKEDKIAKEVFKNFEKEGVVHILTKKPVVAEYSEVKINPRSRSAKLRVAQKN